MDSSAARIWFWSGPAATEDDVVPLLEDNGMTVRRMRHDFRNLQDFGSLLATTVEGTVCGLAIVEGGGIAAAACEVGAVVRLRTGECVFPILYLAETAAGRRAALAAGADACLVRPFDADELLAQVRALLRLGETQQRLLAEAGGARHLNRRLQLAHQRADRELDLARRLLGSFLPPALPMVPSVRLAVHHRPCGRVGGDSYDVFRIDDQHLAFSIADAMGQGMAACLRTAFMREVARSEWRRRDVANGECRVASPPTPRPSPLEPPHFLAAPHEILRHLNRAMVEQRMLDDSLATIALGVLDVTDGLLCFARAGQLPPLHLPAEGRIEAWSMPGPVLGVLEAEFPLHARTLRPGDKVLWFTDGLDAGHLDTQLPGMPSIVACAEHHRNLPVQNFVDALAGDLLRHVDLVDDVTLFALEWTGPMRNDECLMTNNEGMTNGYTSRGRV